MSDLIYLAGLHSLGLSQKKLFKIFGKEKNYRDFYLNLNYENLKKFCTEKEIENILTRQKKFDLEKLKKIIEKDDIQIITKDNKTFPDSLKQIPNSPYLFYLKGEIDKSPKIAIIGSRNMTSYGKKVIEKLIPPLSTYFTTVSGGAMGCDSEAHIQTVLNNGKTIVVVGTGIDIIYPVFNKKLYDIVLEKKGGIMSIFPIGERGNIYNFPIRNEIISALSSGVLVIEAGEKSGTLITVNLALEQGKDVFAIPGEIFRPNSLGCNNLIRNGNAKIVIGVEDIFEEYNIKKENNSSIETKNSFSNQNEKDIYDILVIESLDIDDIIAKTNLSINEVMICLSMLEINGFIKKGINGKYEIK